MKQKKIIFHIINDKLYIKVEDIGISNFMLLTAERRTVTKCNDEYYYHIDEAIRIYESFKEDYLPEEEFYKRICHNIDFFKKAKNKHQEEGLICE